METGPISDPRTDGMAKLLREQAKTTFSYYEWAIREIGQTILPLGRGRRIDTMYTAALYGLNLYERVIIHDPKCAFSENIDKIRSQEASYDEVLAFLNLVETIVPQTLEDSTHPSIRLWPEEVIGLGALCGLPEDKQERGLIREAVKNMLEDLDKTEKRKFGDKLVHKHPGIFNGQSLLPGRQGIRLTADQLVLRASTL